MNQESTQKKFTRVRPRRLQVYYDLQVGQVIELDPGPEDSDASNTPLRPPDHADKEQQKTTDD